MLVSVHAASNCNQNEQLFHSGKLAYQQDTCSDPHKKKNRTRQRACLKVFVGCQGHEFDEPRHHSGFDDLGDWRAVYCRCAQTVTVSMIIALNQRAESGGGRREHTIHARQNSTPLDTINSKSAWPHANNRGVPKDRSCRSPVQPSSCCWGLDETTRACSSLIRDCTSSMAHRGQERGWSPSSSLSTDGATTPLTACRRLFK